MRNPNCILSAIDFNDDPIEIPELARTAGRMVAEHGYVQVVNVPEDFGYVSFCRELGPFVPNYGGPVIGDVRPEPGMEDVYHSGNHQPLTPHTEGYDFKNLPPRYIALWCIAPAAGEGGETTLADTQPWVERLSHEEVAHLYENIFEWKTTDGVQRMGLNLRTYHPVLERHDSGDLIVRFSCNNLIHENDETALKLQADWQQRYSSECIGVRYGKGDLLLWDNWRVLHARNAFTDSRRHLRRIQIGYLPATATDE